MTRATLHPAQEAKYDQECDDSLQLQDAYFSVAKEVGHLGAGRVLAILDATADYAEAQWRDMRQAGKSVADAEAAIWSLVWRHGLALIASKGGAA